MRNEDLDQSRAKPEFVKAFLEDLRQVFQCYLYKVGPYELPFHIAVGLASSGPKVQMLGGHMPPIRNQSAWHSIGRLLKSSD